MSGSPWVSAFIALILAAGGWYFWGTNKTAEIKTVEVIRGTVEQTVSVTGKVKPAKDAKLSFEKGGRIAMVYHRVGDRVGAGEALVALENGDISAQLAQAKAIVRAEEAKLSELKSGTRQEDLQISRTEVQNAVNDATNDIKNGYQSADDAIRNKVDQFMLNPRSSTPQLSFAVNDFQLKTDIESNRLMLEGTLTSWKTSVSALNGTSDVSRFIIEAKTNLRSVQAFLDKVAFAVNALTTSSTLSQTTIDAYKAAISTARTNVTTALGTISASEEKLANANSKLSLKVAGSTADQIKAQEAGLDAAQASVSNLEAQFAKTIIRSPILGIVTKQDAKRGEIASPAVPLVAVISDALYEIEANIPEADIAKVKIGYLARVTLDAYGSDVAFTAVITEINPAETVIDGVPTYTTKLQFKENDPRIKSGMTANTDIAGEKKEDVLFIPGRVITAKAGVKTVTVVEGESVREVTITTGLRGSNGNVEILSGLSEGEMVKSE